MVLLQKGSAGGLGQGHVQLGGGSTVASTRRVEFSVGIGAGEGEGADGAAG